MSSSYSFTARMSSGFDYCERQFTIAEGFCRGITASLSGLSWTHYNAGQGTITQLTPSHLIYQYAGDSNYRMQSHCFFCNPSDSPVTLNFHITATPDNPGFSCGAHIYSVDPDCAIINDAQEPYQPPNNCTTVSIGSYGGNFPGPTSGDVQWVVPANSIIQIYNYVSSVFAEPACTSRIEVTITIL